MKRAFVFMIASFAAAGCVTNGVRGVVHGTPACGEARKGTTFPIDGAKLAISCPDGTNIAVQSDEIGRFFVPLTAPLTGSCKIEVSKQGFKTRTYTLAETCAGEVTEEYPECSAASVFARLVAQ